MIVNIKGVIHSVREDRIVLKAVSGYVHIMMGEDIALDEREDFASRIGKGASVWVEKDVRGELPMGLIPRKKHVPVSYDRRVK